MKTIAKTSGGKGLQMIEMPLPSCQPDEVLIRVNCVSICGTDLHIDRWDYWARQRIKAFPRVIGHEFSGRIVEIGKDVSQFFPGDHVTADSHIPCLVCPLCLRGQPHLCTNLEILGLDRDGCFAEYVAIPERSLWMNESDLPTKIASIQDPLGNAVYATLVEPVSGQEVVVMGDGPIGLFSVGVARAVGAARITLIGLNPLCLDIAKKMGADRVCHADKEDVVQQVLEDTNGIGTDVVVEMSGSPQGIRHGLAMLRKGGRFSAFGLSSESIPIDFSESIIFKGIRLYGISGRKMFETWFQMAGLLNAGRLDPRPVLTHTFPFELFEKGFQIMEAVPREAAKVILVFPESTKSSAGQ
ncbi:MAG: L-threonine 3-dehydrogenase [Nitrospiria bacterium]